MEQVSDVVIKMEEGYEYFVDEEGDVCREKNGKEEKVRKLGLKFEDGYEYFVENGHVYKDLALVGCPKCNYEATYDSNFCSDCGSRLIETIEEGACPRCGNYFEEEAKFCHMCGGKAQ